MFVGPPPLRPYSQEHPIRPKVLGEFQELAREHTIEALDVLVQIMLNEKAPPNARVAAANALLDRAYGKAPNRSCHGACFVVDKPGGGDGRRWPDIGHGTVEIQLTIGPLG